MKRRPRFIIRLVSISVPLLALVLWIQGLLMINRNLQEMGFSREDQPFLESPFGLGVVCGLIAALLLAVNIQLWFRLFRK